MTKIALNLATALLLSMPFTCAEGNGDVAGGGISFTEFGINLYDKFIFESEGELFDLSGNDSKQLVPAGAVLVCVRQAYAIGYYAGGATVTEGERTFEAPKVFFVLKPNGEVTFHLPSPDGNFFGKEITKTIVFEALFEPQQIEKPRKPSE